MFHGKLIKMIKNYKLTKNVFYLFFIEMFLIQNSLINIPGMQFIFYICICLMILVILFNLNILKNLPIPIVLFMFLGWLYFFAVEFTSVPSLLYIISKSVVLIFLSIVAYLFIKNDDGRLLFAVYKFGLLLLFVSLILPDYYSGRATGVFKNANELGSFVVLFYLLIMNLKISKLLLITLSIVCIYLVLATQSRAALVGIMIVFVMSPHGSLKTKILSIVLVIVSFFIFGITLERFFDQGLTNTRSNEWSVATYIISEHFWLGSGLSAYGGMNVQYKWLYDKTGALGAHNGYLTLFMMFGVPLGSILIAFFLYPVIRYLQNIKLLFLNKSNMNLISFTGSVLLFILGFAETMFSGVNNLQANLLWFFYILFLMKNVVQNTRQL